MLATSSSTFIKEFTLFADRAANDGETVVIQRANGKNVVLMSMDKYNRIQKELFLAKQPE